VASVEEAPELGGPFEDATRTSHSGLVAVGLAVAAQDRVASAGSCGGFSTRGSSSSRTMTSA
jgi:hypothetical protein